RRQGHVLKARQEAWSAQGREVDVTATYQTHARSTRIPQSLLVVSLEHRARPGLLLAPEQGRRRLSPVRYAALDAVGTEAYPSIALRTRGNRAPGLTRRPCASSALPGGAKTQSSDGRGVIGFRRVERPLRH